MLLRPGLRPGSPGHRSEDLGCEVERAGQPGSGLPGAARCWGSCRSHLCAHRCPTTHQCPPSTSATGKTASALAAASRPSPGSMVRASAGPGRVGADRAWFPGRQDCTWWRPRVSPAFYAGTAGKEMLRTPVRQPHPHPPHAQGRCAGHEEAPGRKCRPELGCPRHHWPQCYLDR